MTAPEPARLDGRLLAQEEIREFLGFVREARFQPDPLYAAVLALPRTSEELFAWLRDRGLGVGAGAGVVLLTVRRDLWQAGGLDDKDPPAEDGVS
ncbi:hypothetical protein AB0F72_09245 [Actinoplanes sp. NPDC023936]|uniref:hypothetical protein n=1 Tax=Actinoplanes sp. NPDC023936 TaxID=3154910 RepID=UPI0033C058AC